MTADDIRLLYQYDRWANNRMIDAVSALTAEQYTRDLGGAFSSVRDTLVHLIAGEWGWLTYWQEPCPANLGEFWDRIDALFGVSTFPDAHAAQLKWAEVQKAQIDFVKSLTDESLKKTMPLRSTAPSLANLMQHLVNHSTYHRGQIALMLRQLGATPPATDFEEFLALTS